MPIEEVELWPWRKKVFYSEAMAAKAQHEKHLREQARNESEQDARDESGGQGQAPTPDPRKMPSPSELGAQGAQQRQGDDDIHPHLRKYRNIATKR